MRAKRSWNARGGRGPVSAESSGTGQGLVPITWAATLPMRRRAVQAGAHPCVPTTTSPPADAAGPRGGSPPAAHPWTRRLPSGREAPRARDSDHEQREAALGVLTTAAFISSSYILDRTEPIASGRTGAEEDVQHDELRAAFLRGGDRVRERGERGPREIRWRTGRTSSWFTSESVSRRGTRVRETSLRAMSHLH